MSIARRELLTVHLPAALWWLAVTVALAAPQRSFADLPPWFPPFLHVQWIDKVVHALLFGILGLLVARSFRLLPALRRPLLVAFLATSVYGLAVEVGQEVLTDRSGEVGDWLANVFGTALAITPMALGERRR